MQTIATILSLASGFALMRFPEAPAEMIATSLIIDAALAPLTAVVAARRGRSAALWSVLGFAFGMWALAYVLIFRPRQPGAAARPEAPPLPPTSDVA
jgi:hypothetical protein